MVSIEENFHRQECSRMNLIHPTLPILEDHLGDHTPQELGVIVVKEVIPKVKGRLKDETPYPLQVMMVVDISKRNHLQHQHYKIQMMDIYWAMIVTIYHEG